MDQLKFKVSLNLMKFLFSGGGGDGGGLETAFLKSKSGGTLGILITDSP